MALLFSIVESPLHPNLSTLYQQRSIEEMKFSSVRKAIQALKSHRPELVVADFIYGYGNNYAGVNISNLDVFLYSLQKYAPTARVIALVEKSERQYVAKLNDVFPLRGVLEYPVDDAELARLLNA
ncbi:MAG: hypothetical protein AMJ69_06350 [Gammaproteobacteria bacterium SG8_47]|nr:MAG: hypothetical protein AMJ69_06350 [Gammaproteobacteria bacterium SG8_47]